MKGRKDDPKKKNMKVKDLEPRGAADAVGGATVGLASSSLSVAAKGSLDFACGKIGWLPR